MPLLRQRGAKHRKIPIFQDSLDKKSLEERRLANEEAYSRDCGEGRSSRAHSLPNGHHNDQLHGVWAILGTDDTDSCVPSVASGKAERSKKK